MPQTRRKRRADLNAVLRAPSVASSSSASAARLRPLVQASTGNTFNATFSAINNGGVQAGHIGNFQYIRQGQPQTPAPENPWTVPRAPSKLYTGRKDIAKRIEQAFISDGGSAQASQRRYVIAGMGGSGKSEVCLKYAEDHRHEYWAVFWIDCSDHKTAEEGFIEAGMLCGLQQPCISNTKNWLSSTNKEWLLIIDNADDIETDYSRYLPAGINGNIIITTRDERLIKEYSTAGGELLDHLLPLAARELLLRTADRPESCWSSEAQHADAIVDALGSLALAIVQAGAYIEKSCRIQDYLDVYVKHKANLFHFRRDHTHDRYDTVYATFEVSAERLQVLKERGETAASDALELLDILAFMHYEGAFEIVFARATIHCLLRLNHDSDIVNENSIRLSREHAALVPAWFPACNEDLEYDDMRWRQACSILKAFSLITIWKKGVFEILTLHPLVHSWAEQRQTTLKHKNAMRLVAMSNLALSCAVRAVSHSSESHLLSSHLKACFNDKENFPTQNFDSSLLIAIFYQVLVKQFSFGDMCGCSHTLRVLLQFLHRPEITFASRDAEFLELLIMITHIFMKCHKHAEAIDLLEQYCGRLGHNLNDCDRTGLEAHRLLARAYRMDKQRDKAIPLIEQVALRQTEIVNEDVLSFLSTVEELSLAYADGGRIPESLQLLGLVLEISKEVSHPGTDTLISLKYNLAMVYRSGNQVDKAIPLMEDVLSVEKNYFHSVEHRRVVHEMNLAIFYGENGQNRKELELLEQIQRSHEEAGFPSPLELKNALAQAYRENGQNEKSNAMIRRILKERRKAKNRAKSNPIRKNCSISG